MIEFDLSPLIDMLDNISDEPTLRHSALLIIQRERLPILRIGNNIRLHALDCSSLDDWEKIYDFYFSSDHFASISTSAIKKIHPGKLLVSSENGRLLLDGLPSN